MCPGAIRVGADGIASANVIIDAEFLAVWHAEAAIGDLSPGGLAVRELCWQVTIAVVFPNWVAQLTAEDAAEWVTTQSSAALRKWLMGVAWSLPTTRGLAKKIFTRWDVLGRHGRGVVLFYEELEFICRFRCLIFHGIMVDVEFSWFRPIFTAQLQFKFLPCVVCLPAS